MKPYFLLLIVFFIVGCSSELDRCIETNKGLLDKEDINLDITPVNWGDIDISEYALKQYYIDIPELSGYKCFVYEFNNYDDWSLCTETDSAEIPSENATTPIKSDYTYEQKLKFFLGNLYEEYVMQSWGDDTIELSPIAGKNPKYLSISDIYLFIDYRKEIINFFYESGVSSEYLERLSEKLQDEARTLNTLAKVSIQSRLSEMPLEICNAQGIY